MESETPETDKAAYEATARTVGKWIVPLAKARSLERQRNFANARADQAELRMIRAKRERDKAWATLQKVRELFKDDASFGAVVDTLFAKPLEEAKAEIDRLQSLENVKELAPPETAHKSMKQNTNTEAKQDAKLTRNVPSDGATCCASLENKSACCENSAKNAQQIRCCHCNESMKPPNARRIFLHCLECGAHHWVKDSMKLILCKEQPDFLHNVKAHLRGEEEA